MYYEEGQWIKIDGSAVRIAAYKAGEIWVVNAPGCVYQRMGGKWLRRADVGTAADIAVGSDGSVWITCAPEMKEKGVHLMYFDFANEKFIKAKGFGKALAVASNGNPVFILENGELVA